MRMFMILLGVTGLSCSGLAAEGLQTVTLKKPAATSDQPPSRSRCAKKITLGPDKSVVACLMRKHRSAPDH